MRYEEYGVENPEVILLLHGGGLSWWNYRETAEILKTHYHVILPVLDGHSGSDMPFTSIAENAAGVIRLIDTCFGGKVQALGGVSLGGQILVEILTQRPDICKFALLESVQVKPMKLVRDLIKPSIAMSYWLIRKKWFAKIQAKYLGIPRALFADYYRDSCKICKEDMIAFLESNCDYAINSKLRNTQTKVSIVFGSREQASIRASGNILHEMIPNSTVEIIPGFRHGELSLNHPEKFSNILLRMAK